MKITTFIMMVFLLQVAAAGKAQITIRANKASLQSVLEQISEQSGYDFVYSDYDFVNIKAVSVKLDNAPLEQALKVCLADQPLTYRIANKTVVIKRKEEKGFVENLISRFQRLDVRGKVVDETGQPLAGAGVKVKGGKGTTTNAKGEFYLEGLDSDAQLVISYIGYKEIEVSAGSDLGLIRMELSDSKLDEVQVIAYGEQTKRFSLGNVNSVKAADISKNPVSNPLLALQGRVPGLFINQANGLPGAGVSTQIQGRNSIAKGNDPYIVIDGVPFASTLLPGVGGVLGISGNDGNGYTNGNPLSFINPTDIESITILKDADATAIYGSKAANGAILITTKKGEAGDIKFNFDLQNGFGNIGRKMQLMNTQQYLEMRDEALKNDGLQASLTDYDVNGFWDRNQSSDWQKLLIGNTSKYTNYSIGVSGGNLNTQYLIGSTYHKETTVFPGNFSDRKTSLHFNINSTSQNQKFRIQLKGNYLSDNNHLPGIDLTASAISLAPNAPALYNPDGTLNWMLDDNGATTFYNPLADLLNLYQNNTKNLVASSVLSYKFSSNLDFTTSLGYTNLHADEVSINPVSALAPDIRSSSNNVGNYNTSNMTTWIVEPQLRYKFNLLSGRITTLLGTTIQQTKRDGSLIYGIGFPSEALISDLNSASNIFKGGSTNTFYKYNALFGRISYNLKDKYLLDATVRRDGSSRFGANNRFHNFVSIGAGWIISEEFFLKDRLKFLSFAKIKATYGSTGNDQIGEYSFLNLYSQPRIQIPYRGGPSLSPNRLTNPYLQWEETEKINVGFEGGFFKDQILFTANFSRNRSSNQILALPLSSTSGFSSLARNFPGVVQNVNWEFTIHSNNLKDGKLTWSTDFNLTLPKNKLISLPNLEQSDYADFLFIGKPITTLKLYHFEGVDSKTGEYMFSGVNGPTNAPDYSTDRSAYINTAPKYYGGLENTFSYKNFSLSFLLQYVNQIKQDVRYGIGLAGVYNSNQPISVLSRWKQAGDETNRQRFNSDYSLNGSVANLAASDGIYSDASFVRLKNVAIGYQLSPDLVEALKIKNIRLFVLGQNLLTFTNYSGLDPETSAFGGLPPLRVITLGLNATF